MNNILKYLVIVVKIFFVGIIIQIILTAASISILNLILPIIFQKQTGGMLGPDLSNVWRLMNTMGIGHFISTGVASFVCGYLIWRWSGEKKVSIWQSLINGFIVGSLIPVVFFILFSSRSRDLFFITRSTSILYYGLFGSLTGLFGYYLARRKYHQQIPK